MASPKPKRRRPASRNPEPADNGLVTQSEYARHIGKSRQYVSKLVSAGRLPLIDGKIPIIEADARMTATRSIDKRQDQSEIQKANPRPAPASPAGSTTAGAGHPPNTNVVDFHLARATREVYQAKLAELDYRTRIGELVLAADVKKEGYETGRRIRAALEAIPDRLAAQLEAITGISAEQCRALMEAEINAACESLSDAGWT